MKQQDPLPKTLTLLNKLYRLLLLLYPANFRREYRREMQLVVYSSCYDAYKQCGTNGMFRFWVLVFFDLSKTIFIEYWEVFTMKSSVWIRVFIALAVGTILGALCGMGYAYLTAICCLTASLIYIGLLGAFFGLMVTLIATTLFIKNVEIHLANGRIFFIASAIGAVIGIIFPLIFSIGRAPTSVIVYYTIGGAVIGLLMTPMLSKASLFWQKTHPHHLDSPTVE